MCFETFSNPKDAIARETGIKDMARAKKLALINAPNPKWRDLMADMLED